MEAALIALLLPAFVGIMSTLATKTPNTAKGKFAQRVLNVINACGMNVGKAKNAE